MKYSAVSLLQQALGGQRKWPPFIAPTKLKTHYDIIIIGAGGHGLATAHYLAENHDVDKVLVLDSGWLGGGNTARNTAIVRSDYLLPASFALKNFALELWAQLSQELNFNLMYSPRGYIDLAHSDGELDHFMVRANAMRLAGADVDMLNRREIAERVPGIYLGRDARYPISGALYQPAGGVLRHDAVAWGFARSASNRGVHIQQSCAVQGFDIHSNRVVGVNTPLGRIGAGKVFVSAAGATASLAQLAGLRLPMEPINVQAFVTEPVKPVLDSVVNYNAGLSYISQSDKGELVLGGATDGYLSEARRGSFARIEDTLARALQIFPFLAQLRLLRHWSGTADIPMDGNAIIGATPVDGLFLNCGWGYAGFKATPAVGYSMAQYLASGRLPELLQPFALERFGSGALIDDAGIGPYPWRH